MPASPVPASDDVALAEIASLAARLGETPGRNQLMEEFGWGASRSTRLLRLFEKQSADSQSGGQAEAKTAAGPPARRAADGQSGGEQSASPRRSGAGSDRRSTPEETDQPARPDRQSAQDSGQSTRTGPADRPAQTDEIEAPGPAAEPLVQSGQTAPAPTGWTGGTEGQAGPVDHAADRTGTPWGLLSAVLAIAASAFVAIWGGWVGLGRMAGFGTVNLLPGIGDGLHVNLAITLPLGIESYAAAALYVAVGGLVTGRARWFAALSAAAALALGAFGQAAFHLLEARGVHVAPDSIVVFVSVLPVFVLGAAGVLLHLVLEERKR